jgi:restriction system protein
LEGVLGHRTKGLAARRSDVEQTFNASGPEALTGAIQQALAASVYPEGLRGTCRAAYRPELREVLIDYELTPRSTVPQVVAYWYVKSKNLIQPEPRKDTDVKRLYSQLIARVTLRVLAEAFDIAPVTLVGGIVFNGYVSSKDRATGKATRPCVISVNATREGFEEIVLDEPELDPVLCLRSYLNAIVSPHPYDLEPVRPVLQFDLSKYKFIDEAMDVVAGLDSRTDLLTLKPVEFEHLVRRLFEAIGMKSWVTQASRDDGVDAVATNEDPIVGGLCIIQAKRYSKIVRHEAIQALAGVMEDKAAAKGVLVTTSWVGKASRDFAARNGRMEIIEGRELKSMLKEHLDLDVLINLPTLPPSWNQNDIS